MARMQPSRSPAPRDGMFALGSEPVVAVAWGAVVLLLVLLLFTDWQTPDIFYHIALGQGVLDTGRAQPPETVLAVQPEYVNIYWLFQVVCAAIFGVAGPLGLTLLFAAAWVGIFLLWVSVTKLALRPAVGLPLAIAAVLVLQARFDPRPEVVSYLLLMIEMRWLLSWDFERPISARRLILFGLVQAVWTNVHGFFVVGPFLVGAMLLSRTVDRRVAGRGATRQLARLLAVAIVASLLSPFGPKAWVFVVTLWRLGRDMPQSILELRPPTAEVFRKVWTMYVFYALWIATALAVLWMLARRRLRLFAAMAAIPALAASATGVRYMPVLLLLAAPIWREWFGGTVRAARPSRRRAVVITAGVSAVVALGLAGWVASGRFHRSLLSPARFGVGLQRAAYPVALAQHMIDTGFAGRVYNNSADGGYLAYRVAGVEPYIDSRYVQPAVVQEYFASLRDGEAFARLDARHRFDAADLRLVESPQLIGTLLRDPSWRLAYGDLHRAFFVKREGEGEREGASRELEEPFFSIWDGEDLSQRAEGMSAIQWVLVLAKAGERALLLRALDQLGRAPQVPSYVIAYAVDYGTQRRDAEIVARARALYPKMHALDDEERAMVARLMRAAAEAMPE